MEVQRKMYFITKRSKMDTHGNVITTTDPGLFWRKFHRSKYMYDGAQRLGTMSRMKFRGQDKVDYPWVLEEYSSYQPNHEFVICKVEYTAVPIYNPQDPYHPNLHPLAANNQNFGNPPSTSYGIINNGGNGGSNGDHLHVGSGGIGGGLNFGGGLGLIAGEVLPCFSLDSGDGHLGNAPNADSEDGNLGYPNAASTSNGLFDTWGFNGDDHPNIGNGGSGDGLNLGGSLGVIAGEAVQGLRRDEFDTGNGGRANHSNIGDGGSGGGLNLGWSACVVAGEAQPGLQRDAGSSTEMLVHPSSNSASVAGPAIEGGSSLPNPPSLNVDGGSGTQPEEDLSWYTWGDEDRAGSNGGEVVVNEEWLQNNVDFDVDVDVVPNGGAANQELLLNNVVFDEVHPGSGGPGENGLEK